MQNTLRITGTALLALTGLVGLAACGDDGPERPATSTEVPVSDSTEPTQSEPTGTMPTDDTVDDAENAALLLDAAEALDGLEEAQAEEIAEENGWILRVTERDGEPQAATMDYRDNRVNVAVEDGIVVNVLNIG